MIKTALLLPLVFVAASMAQTTAPTTAPAESPALRRGVNLSHWYAQWSDYDEKRLATYNTQADTDLIRSMGFDHVRLTLDPVAVFTTAPGQLDAGKLKRLRARVDRYIASKIAVIIDLQPTDDFKKALKTGDNQLALIQNWAALARAFADVDPNWIVLEVMNEPGDATRPFWRDLQLKTAQAIRAAAPKLAIIVSGGGWSSVDDIIKFQPYDLPNLIYTFHFYDPMMFTHQQASWVGEAIRNVRDLDWPIAPEQAAAVTAKTTSTTQAAKDTQWNIAQGDMTAEYIIRRMNAVATWQTAHPGIRVYAGEFGAFRKAPRPALLRWHAAVRAAIESHHWGWAIWDYAGGFAVAPGKPGERTPDEEVLRAIGLHP